MQQGQSYVIVSRNHVLDIDSIQQNKKDTS